ncbi:MAG: transcription initiation factor IIB family protein [Candidatus Nanohaloarchaea archaeon]
MSDVKQSEEVIPVRDSDRPSNPGDDSKRECPNCGSTNFAENQAKGELYCIKCGQIVDEDRIDFSREFRAFSSEERQKKERSGSSVTYTQADRGMSTRIGNSSELRRLSGRKRQQYQRMQKWDRRITDSKKRSMQKALSILKQMVSDLKLPRSLFEEAARMTEKAQERDVLKGRGIEATVAALVFILARNQGIPRTMDEVADAASIKKRKLGKTYRHILKEFDDIEKKPANPEDFLPRYSEDLRLSGKTNARARKIIRKARDKGALAGRSPGAVVAAAIYIATLLEDEKINQKDIAETVNVTEVTVRKNYSEIAEALGIEEEIEDAKKR